VQVLALQSQGYLLCFVPREQLRLSEGESDFATFVSTSM
jgi:hypothetical protein